MRRVRPRLEPILALDRVREAPRPLHARIRLRDVHDRLRVDQLRVLAYVVCTLC